MSFKKLVKKELAKVREGHGPIASAHEGFAVLLEEVEEFKDEVWLKRSLRSKERMLAELVQVAVVAQRTAEDLGLV